MNQGLAYVLTNWALTLVIYFVFSLRIYSRTLITRSVGSDDFTIAFSVVLSTFAAVVNTIQVHAGLGRHQSELTPEQYSINEHWEYVGWLEAFICYFFTRTSILLFVLRLLPAYKVWQHRLVYVTFFLNFAITVVATVSFGIACIPFEGLWKKDLPGAKCYPLELLVLTQRVNGILACVVDIITALIPALLLLNVKMRRKTRWTLNIIFLLGLGTAALSIGRVVTVTRWAIEYDMSFRLIPAKYFANHEEKFGIIIACLPALRQFGAYRVRTGTFMPDRSKRQEPNEDFVKMRRRINLRDIFWYRKAVSTGGRVMDARPIFQAKTPMGPTPPPKTEQDGISRRAQVSALDSWQHRVKDLFSTSASREEGNARRKWFGVPLWSVPDTRRSSDQEHLAGLENDTNGTTTTTREGRRIKQNYKRWGLLPRSNGSSDRTNESNLSGKDRYLTMDSGDASKSDGKEQDVALMDMLANPTAKEGTSDPKDVV
ncbi:MAG: hypothetical protein M1831_001323 [Alyxoria varia]|nr:MAG: hypothetical protein M1831_001323 [Alyxoria varia]